jgi:hypothetical protein
MRSRRRDEIGRANDGGISPRPSRGLARGGEEGLRFSVRVTSAPPNIGIAVNLIAGAPQAGHAIAVYVALPRQELIDGDVVDAARLFDRQPAAARLR